MSMTLVEPRWPVLGRHECAVEWLRVWADLGRAPRTIDAYSRDGPLIGFPRAVAAIRAVKHL
jgi:hypothetical protein